MKTIIAPTDFSPVSLNAVDYAADMAASIGANLTLLHMYSVPITVGEVPVLPAYLDEIEDDARIRLTDVKEKILGRLNDSIVIHAEVKFGDVVNEISEYCDRVKPYAVVMGSESSSAADRFFFGARTFEAMKELKWPLVVVPPDATFRNIKKIGLACDLRDVIQSVHVEEIKQLVGEFKAELYILHVSEEIPGSAAAYDEEDETDRLREMFGEINPKFYSLNNTDIETGIIGFAEKNKLDLLIIIPKSHDFVSRIFQRSHSRRLVLHSHLPVMAIHE